MKLLHDLVLVRPAKDTQLKNGLIIPNQVKSQCIGEIVLIGAKVKELNIGDVVFYNEQFGTAINYHNEPMVLLNESTHIKAVQ